MKMPKILQRLLTKKIFLKLPIEAGRISRETSMEMLERFQKEWSFIDPDIPAHILEAIERFTLIIPDLSQNAKNIVNLGNTGHELEVVAATERIITQAEERLNLLARTIYPYGGTDGLINKMLSDIATFGSPSIEAVIQPDKKGVKKVVIVPHHEIRFKYDKEQDEYIAHQKAGNSPEDYLELNPLTYYYSPLFQRRNSPYAIPPVLAAISPLLNQLFMTENIRYIIKKLGLLGLIHAILTTPTRKTTETEEQYLNRLKTYLSDVSTDLTKNYRDGVMITYDEFELKHFDVTGDIRGVKDLFQLNEEQFASGMGSDPAMLGRTYSTTETYAGVVYNKMIREIDNARRITRRGIEKIYLLDLLLAEIPVEDVNTEFSPNAQLKPAEDAEIKEKDRKSIGDLYLNGIITLDEAREDLGYPPIETVTGEAAAGKIRATFKFQNNRYVFHHPQISLRMYVSPRMKGWIQTQSEEALENQRLDFIETYLKEMLKIDDQVRTEIMGELQDRAGQGQLPQDTEGFVNEVFRIIETHYPIIARRLNARDQIRQNIETIYTFYRITDTSLWGDEPPLKTKLQQPDVRAQEFLSRMDDIYFSEYVQNQDFKNQLSDFLRNEVMEKGLQATDEILERFGTEWADNSELQVRRIIDTSLTRVRTFAHVRQMKQAGIKELEIVEIMDRITCGMCREADGRIVRVAVADELVEAALNISTEDFRSRYITNPTTEREMMGSSAEDLVRQGKGLPPFHPSCRGRTKSGFKKSLSQIQGEQGELPDIEKHMNGDYADYGKKITYDYTEKGRPGRLKTKQTLIYSIQNPHGKKVYLTQEGIRHTVNAHPDQRAERESALSVAGSIVANPDRMYIDQRRGNDTKVYTRHIRGIDYGVVTKRMGPEVIWSAFRYKQPSPGWSEIWHRR